MPANPMEKPATARIAIQKLDEDQNPSRGAKRIVILNPVGVALPARVFPVFPRKGVVLSRITPRTDVILFSLALFLYLATRFTGLNQYPIFFHGDEAIHTVYASELIRDHGVFEGKTFLPTYFKNGTKYNLSLSVYLQILPVWLFGKSVLVTRGVSILLTLIPAAAVALIVRDFLKLPYWWATTLLLSLVPAWFLHSRTAFETVLSVSMYAGFLYFYLRYRLENPKSLYAALTFGALTFYAYSPAQLIIVLCGLILLLADLRYHLKHWKTGLGGLAWLLFLTLPYIRFRLTVSAPILEHLRDLDSYWLAPVPLTEKWLRFWQEYTYGLSPGYWYLHNAQDLPRHQMGAYGHLLRVTLPFALWGLFVALKTINLPVRAALTALQTRVTGLFRPLKDSKPDDSPSLSELPPRAAQNDTAKITYRTLLIALLIAPLPGTLAQVGITRVLTFIIPITILTAVGFITCLQWMEKGLSARWIGIGVFTLLVGGMGFFTYDAITNVSFFVQDYGFSGMQYGAQPLFNEINTYLDSPNDVHIILSPDWANGSDDLKEFFLDDPFAIEMANIESFLVQKRELSPNDLLILTPGEYERARSSNKFKTVEVEKTLPYPNGEPGFYFVRLSYIDQIEEILAEERAAQLVLEEAPLSLDGVPVLVHYSQLDIGSIGLAFDNNDETLIRTNRVNPFVLEMVLPEKREFHGISVNLGAAKIRLTVQLFPDPNGEPIEFSADAQTNLEGPIVIMNFGRSVFAEVIRIEVLLLEDTEFGHVHIWEIRFLSD